MYRRNLKAIIVAFVLVSGFGIGTAAHVSAADTMSPQGAAQSKSVNQNVATGTKVVTGTVTDPSGETLIGLTVKVSGTNVAFLMDCGFEESQLDSVCITFDKMDKVGLEGVRKELEDKEFDKAAVDKFTDFLSGVDNPQQITLATKTEW